MFRFFMIFLICMSMYEYFLKDIIYERYGHIIQKMMYGKNGQKFDGTFTFSNHPSSKTKAKKSEETDNKKLKVVDLFRKNDVEKAQYEPLTSFQHLSEAMNAIRSEYAQIIVDTHTYGKVTIKLVKDSDVDRYYIYIGDLFVLSGQNRLINWQLQIPATIQEDILVYIQDQVIEENYKVEKNIINDSPMNLASIQHIFSGYIMEKNKK